jgi:hypothetical protein
VGGRGVLSMEQGTKFLPVDEIYSMFCCTFGEKKGPKRGGLRWRERDTFYGGYFVRLDSDHHRYGGLCACGM